MTWEGAFVASQERLMAARARPAGRTPGPVVVALVMAVLAASLAQTIVLAVLPRFAAGLDASTTEVTWVLTAFMLSSAVATPIAGRLGDLAGYRRVLVGCLCCFTAGSLVCALAGGSLGVLIAGRALQGVAGGVFPLSFGIARTAVPPARLPGIIALLSAMFGIGGSAGMVVAGPLVDVLGTSSLFWGTLVLGGAALAAVPALPRVRPSRGGRLDLGGAVLLSGALVCLLLAISQGRPWGWGSAAVAGLFAGGAVLLAAFGVLESRIADPLVDLRLMGRRGQATTNLATFVVAMAMFGAITLVPRFVQAPAAGYGFGSSPSEAGLIMLPMALVMLVAGPAAARLGDRRGGRTPLLAGAVCAAVSLAVLAAAHGHLVNFYLVGLLIGAGYGLAFAAMGLLIVQSAPAHQTGVATGINTIVRTVAAAIGAQLAAVLLEARTPAGGPLPDESGYTLGFTVFAVLGVAAIAAGALVPGRSAGRPGDQAGA
ncbi:MFS transporter [Actinomadura sp. 9N215]|uniref:MFS transporter n=1 Tax=Actinomadura sp. 9N215 TaxID=3375150 RepID=UPI0037A31493